MDDEVQCRAVASGEVPGLMAAYRRAVRGADQVRAGLIAAGLDPDEVTVVAGLAEDGESAVHVTAFPVLAVALSALLTDDARPLPRLRHWHPHQGDPDVA
jgi:hypothetical protein